MEWHYIVLLLLVAAAAGWVDAVVGGGGLLLVPALLLGLPNLPPVTALGTNKVASICGTTTAAITYARRTKIDWRLAGPAAALAVVFAATGALAASHIPAAYFRPAVLVLLLLVLAFIVARPSFGVVVSEPSRTWRRRIAALLLAGTVIAFYDGVFGPGTGTFLIITFTAVLGLDFVASSATAKILNAGTNLGALLVFAAGGHVLWKLGLAMAVCNIIGARFGARTALKRGAGFVRVVLVVVVVAMVARLGTQYV
ncbi:sulfite exporter TauE/SafE family protein [Actinoplanes solisilvae]|uniref:sulfite exporter TauE/SafE family protein n=1 Tax=Actinoplanes solisilvae TaxID=2486853 RepID=UPI001F0CC4DA|nr:TSUP family transporter [Actinoplanes solisilvae]